MPYAWPICRLAVHCSVSPAGAAVDPDPGWLARRGQGPEPESTTKPPEPEWGLMLNTLRTAIYVNPLVAALPGLAIFLVSISFNLFSDGLRSAMEVKA